MNLAAVRHLLRLLLLLHCHSLLLLSRCHLLLLLSCLKSSCAQLLLT
jgi:hypothetical protein